MFMNEIRYKFKPIHGFRREAIRGALNSI